MPIFQETSVALRDEVKQLISSAELFVDLKALESNYHHIQKIAFPAQVSPVLKANAYGVGIQGVAPCLWKAGARHFFVATVEEGIELRALLPQSKIYILNGFMPGEEKQLFLHSLIPVICSYEMADTLYLFSKQKGYVSEVALQFNTGLMRLGFRKEEAALFLKGGKFDPFLKVIHILTQFASSTILNHPQNIEQEIAFNSIAELFSDQVKSFASSAALAHGFSSLHDMVRPGISLYGISPGRKIEELKHVTTLQAPVIQIFEGCVGEKVGYDGTYILERPSRLATIGFGYADGYPTSLMNKGHVQIGNYKAPILGRISMDLMTVDVTDIPQSLLYLGMSSILWGKDPRIEEVSSLSNTLTNSLLTGLGRRVKRVYA